MRTALQSNERIILSSKVGAPNGKPGDLLPQLATGDLILTSERLVFEAERTEDATDQAIDLRQVLRVATGWIRMLDLIPLYPCLEVHTGEGSLHRFASVQLGATKPGEWAAAIVATQASLRLPAAAPVEAGAIIDSEPPYATGATPAVVAGIPEAPSPSREAPAFTDDRLAWALVGVPLAGAAFEYLAGASISAIVAGFLTLGANVALTQIDIRKLHAAGQGAPNGWWALLVPVYLWKRAAILRRRQITTLAWIAAFLISLLIGFDTGKTRLADTACPVVTDIIRNQLNGETSCRRVTITEDLGDGFYTARASLANGNTIRISIEVRGSDIYVQIPPQ